MVSTMFVQRSTEKLKAVPLSNDTVGRHICNISDDFERQLIGKASERKFGYFWRRRK